MTIKIFTTQYEDGIVVNNSLINNIIAGHLYDSPDMTMQRNNEGNNIGDRADKFFDLATIYWAWKNLDLQHYGFCHNNRFISFGKTMDSDVYSNVYFDSFNDSIVELMGYNKKDLVDEIKGWDIILTEPWDVRKVGIANLYDQYVSVGGTYKKDIECAISILKEKYPGYSEDADYYMNGHTFYPYNIFIMKKEIFFEYCEWLFDILFELEKRIDTSHYSKPSLRMLSEVGERLLGIFVHHKKMQQQISVDTKQRFCFGEMTEYLLPTPHFDSKNVSIVFSSDDYNAILIAASVKSLIETSKIVNNYDIFILFDKLEEDNKKMISLIAKNRGNINIEFVDINLFSRRCGLSTNITFSREIFTLLAPELFTHFDKILCIDSDTMILRDVADLFNTDIGDNLLAGAVDPEFISQYNGACLKTKIYTDEELKLKDPYLYFSTGVLIFNLREMRKKFQKYELLKAWNSRHYMHGYQDMLNVKCEGKVKYLDMAWNTKNSCNGIRTRLIESYAPREVAELYFKSRKSPFIVHFSGDSKPWNNPSDEFADEYWRLIRDTDFYEKMLFYPPDN